MDGQDADLTPVEATNTIVWLATLGKGGVSGAFSGIENLYPGRPPNNKPFNFKILRINYMNFY